MNITFVISSLFAGGAQRVMTHMANYWAGHKLKITILTFTDESAEPFFELDESVRVIKLNVVRKSSNIVAGLWNNLRRICILRRAIRKNGSRIVISFIDQVNVLTLLATLGLDSKVIVSERSDPNIYRIGRVWEWLRWWIYSRADRIVVQTNAAREYFLPKYRDRIIVIPNPVIMAGIGDRTETEYSANRSIVAIGRLTAEKQYDLLLGAFAKIKDKYPDWSVTILGEGQMRPVLESMCARLGIAGRVFMPGNVKNIHHYLSHAGLYVMSSLIEGFPNALCEAMASGLPVIATECTGGIREIICDGENGVLIPPKDETALATAMAFLMGNDRERRRLGRSAVEIGRNYNLEKIMALWGQAVSIPCE